MQQSLCGGRAATCAPRNAARPALPRVAVGQRTATNAVAVGTRHRAGLPSSRVAARVTIESGSRAGLQTFVATGGWDGKSEEPGVRFETPEAAIQAMPQPKQGVLVAAIFGYIFALSAAGINYTDLGIYRDSAILPPLMGALFAAAGVGHFTIHDAFASMMPYQGAWGWWYLPGSDRFHVNWTGVAEVAGGVGLIASCIPPVADALPWLKSASALGLCALCVVVTPSNVFMLTHNAPGPTAVSPNAPPTLPLAGHAVRLTMQAFLITCFWGMANI